MPLSDIPGRAFLDTNVVNFMLKFGHQIHDGADNPSGLSSYEQRDIDALYNIFLTGQRADWQLAISPFTYFEIANTHDPNRKHSLSNWFLQIWEHWVSIVENNNDLPTLIEAERIRTSLLTSEALVDLPDIHDRILIIDAIVYRCDCFCTRDWSTILSKHDKLNDLGMPILTPSEWWDRIRPYASLWA